MVANLRKRAEQDLAVTLEGPDWGMPIELVSPTTGQEYSVNGQVIYKTLETDPTTGVRILVEKPVVTVRLSSLSEKPNPGETWLVRIPRAPEADEPKDNYVTEIAHEHGRSIGFIRLPLTKAGQS